MAAIQSKTPKVLRLNSPMFHTQAKGDPISWKLSKAELSELFPASRLFFSLNGVPGGYSRASIGLIPRFRVTRRGETQRIWEQNMLPFSPILAFIQTLQWAVCPP